MVVFSLFLIPKTRWRLFLLAPEWVPRACCSSPAPGRTSTNFTASKGVLLWALVRCDGTVQRNFRYISDTGHVIILDCQNWAEIEVESSRERTRPFSAATARATHPQATMKFSQGAVLRRGMRMMMATMGGIEGEWKSQRWMARSMDDAWGCAKRSDGRWHRILHPSDPATCRASRALHRARKPLPVPNSRASLCVLSG